MKNDYWAYEGRIPYTKPWYLDPGYHYPPPKWEDKERKSIIQVSRWVRNTCYWIGTRVLGMKDSYTEYDASGERDLDEKADLIEL